MMEPFAIVHWSDKGTSIIHLGNVTRLKKSVYHEGDYIYHMYGKRLYRARISEIHEKKGYLKSLEEDGLLPVEYEYDSEDADMYEESFKTSSDSLGKVGNIESTTEKKRQSTPKKKEKQSPSTDGLQHEAQKQLTEKLLSKQRRTSPRKRPAPSNPFDADCLDAFIGASHASSTVKKNVTATIPTMDEHESPMKKKQTAPYVIPPPSVKEKHSSNASDSSGDQKVCGPENQKEDYVSRKEFKDLQRKYRSLRDRIEVLEKQQSGKNPNASDSSPLLPVTSTVITQSESIKSLYNGKSYSELEDSVSHVDSLFTCVHNILLQLFSTDYIIAHSVSGQPSNSSCTPKPKFDGRLYETMVSIVAKKYPKATKSDITKKVQAVQKKYQLQKNKN